MRSEKKKKIKFLHLLRRVLSSRGRKDELLNQLSTVCRRKVWVTFKQNIRCVISLCAARRHPESAADLKRALWLSREAHDPAWLCSPWYPSCLIQSKDRNLNFSGSRSCYLSGAAAELMLLALMSSQFLKLRSSLCTQTVLYPAQESSALGTVIIIRSDNWSKKGKLLVDIPKWLFNRTVCNQQKGLDQKAINLVI